MSHKILSITTGMFKTLRYCTAAVLLSASVPMVVHGDDSIKVLASIKPLALMANDLGLTWQAPIIPDGVNIHDFTLRPSQVKRVNEADMVVWLGAELEPHLAALMEKVPSNKQVILSPDTVSVTALHDEHKNDNHAHEQEHEQATHTDHEKHEDNKDHDEHDGHEDHEGHAHGDMHVWTNPNFIANGMEVLAHAIGAAHPALEHELVHTAEQQIHELHEIIEAMHLQFDNLPKGKGYLVYHDALHPFEEAMELSTLASFTDTNDVKTGARGLAKIQTLVSENKVACVLMDPESNADLVNRVATDVAQVNIDILGWYIVPNGSSQVEYFTQLANAFDTCFQ